MQRQAFMKFHNTAPQPHSGYTDVKVEGTFKGEHFHYCAVWFSREGCRGRHWPSALRDVVFLHKAERAR